MLRATGSSQARLEAAFRLFAMGDAERTVDGTPDFMPVATRHFAQRKRPVTLPNGWIVGAKLEGEIDAEARKFVNEIALLAAPDTIGAVVEAAAQIDPTAREWLPPLIAALRRNRTEVVRIDQATKCLHLEIVQAHTWIDDAGNVHRGRAPLTRVEVEYATRLRELRHFKKRPIQYEDSTTTLERVDLRTGKPSQPPRVPRVIRIVDNGSEEWHVLEALPLDAQTDDERIEAAQHGEIAWKR